MQRTWAALLVVVAACSDDPFPPAFYESPDLRSPIAVNDSALYYVEERNFDRRLAELGLDGVARGLVSTLPLVFDVHVRGSTIEWLAGRQLVRSGPAGMEMATLPADDSYRSIVLGPTGTFVTADALDDLASTIFFWGPNGLVQLPIEPMSMRVVAADATHVYVVRSPGGLLVRYPLAGGAEESLADDVADAAISDDKLIYGTSTELVERSLVDDSERILQTRPANARSVPSPVVVAGDVVFWGNLRVMDGQIEEFLLPSSTGFIRAVAANSTDVYWVSTMKVGPLMQGEPSDFKLHRAPIHGERPF